MKIKIIMTLSILWIASSSLYSMDLPDPQEKICFLGTSVFSLANAIADPSPDFYQFDFGVKLSQKDVLFLEVITWRYDFPLGIPYGDDFENELYRYPGTIRDLGVGLGYKRFLWKGFNASIHAVPFYRWYTDENDILINTGFQLYTTLRSGYQFLLFKENLFIEPSICFNYWPVVTHLPAGFSEQEKNWPNYFLFEPGLNIGWRF